MSAEPQPRIRILLVDDHVVMRQGLRMLIENEPDMAVVAEASRCEEALEVAMREKPDVVLLDLDLGHGSGTDIIPQLTSGGGMRVLVLTGLRESEVHRLAIRLGAVGLILKDQAGEVLIKAIRKVHSGEVWVDHSMTATILRELRAGRNGDRLDTEAARIDSLTPREREVVSLIAQGFSTCRIAETLYISEKTVRNHLASIYDKLQMPDRLELAIYAIRHGLAPSPQ